MNRYTKIVAGALTISTATFGATQAATVYIPNGSAGARSTH